MAEPAKKRRRVVYLEEDEDVEDALAREAKEATYFEELRAGRTTIELLDLDTSPITRD